MKTQQVIFERNSFGRKKGDENAHSISNVNETEAESMDVDFRRRVVWVVSGSHHYFIPFEALCMIYGTRSDADAELQTNGKGRR